MNKLFIVFFGLILFLPLQYAAAVNLYTCEQAIDGTCAHFLYGDGYETGNYIASGEPGGLYCVVESLNNSTECIFDATECPDPAPSGVDGHNIPGIVVCTGCEGSPFSINEAKCCLIYGQSTNPNTGDPLC